MATRSLPALDPIETDAVVGPLLNHLARQAGVVYSVTEGDEPGTANTSRPCSPAIRAVIRVPERFAASTTTTPAG